MSRPTLLAAGLLGLFLTLLMQPNAASAQCSGGYSKIKWSYHDDVGGYYGYCPSDSYYINFCQYNYNCDGAYVNFGNCSFINCPTEGAGYLRDYYDGRILSNTCSGACIQQQREPEVCTAGSSGTSAPINAGCGNDERSCASLANGADGAPVRFASGRVETKPLTFVEAPTPDGIFFGYRLQWSSHREHVAARGGRIVDNVTEQQPTVHHHDETTYYIGKGWMDDFSDRLYIRTQNKQDDEIVWQSREATVTFRAALGWKSWGGKYELVDRGTDPAAWGFGDNFGRWVIRTTDPTKPRKAWAFQEYAYTAYGNTTPTYALGRLTRHVLLKTNLSTLTANYGYTVAWNPDGYISSVTDSFGRQLTFSYSTNPVSGTPVTLRGLSSVTYLASGSATPLVVSFIRTSDWMSLDRIDVSPTGTAAPEYVRFLYNRNIKYPPCGNCPVVLTDVIVPGVASSSTAVGALPLATEVVVEHNDYTAPSPTDPFTIPGLRSLYSKYPGREYAYQFNPPMNGAITGAQFDLQQYTGQPAGTCAFPTDPGVCPAGSQCRSDDGKCYVANLFTHASDTRLPTSKTFGSSSTSTSYSTGTVISGAPRSSIDPGGVRTSFGYDTLGRLRCRVVGDDDEEAFASPTAPDSSECAGPANAQVVKVDYSGACTDGQTLCTRKTTTSVLSGTVVEEEDLSTAIRLPVRLKTTGQTRDVNGSLVSETHITTRSYDTYQRLVEINGPLNDAVALDKTRYAYWTSGDNNNGHLMSVTRYVGTSTSNIALVTEYSSYDAWGIPHVIKQPSGDWVEYVTTDRLSWTIKQWSAVNLLLNTSYVTLSPNGSVRKTIDADNVCMTYEYTSEGAVSRIRRSSNDATCGSLPVNVNSGEVEMRSYIAGDPDRLESIERRTNGVVEFIYEGFTYDRDRRLQSADTMHSTSPFTFTFTDVLQTGVTAPEGPGPGTWRTEQTVDDFARPTALLRFIDGTNKLTHTFGYSSAFSPRPTQVTRGYNGAATSVSTFEYDDFGRLVSATVPEAGTPGSATTTRYEYDVGGRLTKKRSGTGTPLVRTDVYTNDSLGRVLSVDNDTEHPVNCASAPVGTPIQDVEYKYDVCDASDAPTGFTCNNAVGRMTIARSILQCGTGGVVVKRGRWYDYTAAGQVSRVAYATVTGSTIGPPAIMDYLYSNAGRMLQYRSPINNIYGTKFTYSRGRVVQLTTTQSTPVLLANGMTYNAFGPLATLTSNVTQVSGSSTRNLKYESVHYNEGQLNQFKWRLVHSGGPVVSPISLVYQNLSYTPAGLIKDRYDFGSYEQSRYYGYDSLLRLTCEARGQTSTSTTPTSAHCTQSSALAAALHTYGNGQSASSPPDVRLTSFVRGEVTWEAGGFSYMSPSTETSTYSSGSSQVQGITRSTSSLVLGYDAVGRRTYDYDNFDSTRSRRDYTYLPNGQLGTISGRTSDGVQYSTSVRYDESGRPLTINESLGDAYELFWDDADRLIAANITFNAPRLCGWFVSCSGIRWHYHYLDKRLIAATREMIPVSGGFGAPDEAVLRLFAISDERGLVHRLVNSSGNTYWNARWDASGTRTWVARPVSELWVPFGLPGQVILGKTTYNREVNSGFSEVATRWGTEAYASGSGGTWTRPPIALNQWRAYDPLAGAFLQPDPNDQIGRVMPEGYMYGRGSPVTFADSSGGESSWRDAFTTSVGIDPYNFDASCDARAFEIRAAIAAAIRAVTNCFGAECLLPGNEKRMWLHALETGEYVCAGSGLSSRSIKRKFGEGYYSWDTALNYGAGGLRFNFQRGPTSPWEKQKSGTQATVWEGDKGRLADRITALGPNLGDGDDCLAASIAHEALHGVLNTTGGAFYNASHGHNPPYVRNSMEQEQRIKDAVHLCVNNQCDLP